MISFISVQPAFETTTYRRPRSTYCFNKQSADHISLSYTSFDGIEACERGIVKPLSLFGKLLYECIGTGRV